MWGLLRGSTWRNASMLLVRLQKGLDPDALVCILSSTGWHQCPSVRDSGCRCRKEEVSAGRWVIFPVWSQRRLRVVIMVFDHINKVTLHRAWFVLRWVWAEKWQPVKGQWQGCVFGKITVGLLSLLQCVTDSVVYPLSTYGFSGLRSAN